MGRKRPYGYWKDSSNIFKELEELTDSLNHVPTLPELVQMGRNDLNKAIQKTGGIKKYRKLLSRDHEGRKRLEDYRDWKVISMEFKYLINELGYFPTAKELKERKKNYLLNAATKFHGGLPKIRLRLGYEPLQNSFKYWESYNNVLREANKIISKYGNLPSAQKLQTEGYTTFVNAVSTYHGGFSKFRKSLGFEPLQNVDTGYWQNLENIRREIIQLKEIIGDYPVAGDFKMHGKLNILTAIEHHYVGLRNLYILLDIPTDNLNKPHNYYTDWENVKRDFNNIIKKIGHFPSDQELLFLEETSLRGALRKHGGLKAIAKKLGITSRYLIANDGHYCDSFAEKIIDDILFNAGIPHRRGITLLINNHKVVPDFILSNRLIIEVLMIDPNIHPRNGIERNYNINYQRKKALYYEEEYEVFEILPEDYTNESHLYQKIKSLYEKLEMNTVNLDILITCNYTHSDKKPIGYWINIENVKQELMPLCMKLNRFPTYSEIISCFGSSVVHAIRRHHKSYENVASLMGYEYKRDIYRKTSGYWKDRKVVADALKKIIKKQGVFPRASYLLKNHGSLYYAINKYHGGLATFKTLNSEF